jgi:hypothetical protein
MSDTILWCSKSSHLRLPNETYKQGRKHYLTSEQYKIAARSRIEFIKWARSKRYCFPCEGTHQSNNYGIGISWHDHCCDQMQKWGKPILECLKIWAVEVATLEELEIQAEHALRLYQRIKAEEIPYSKEYGKNRTAKWRKHRQLWLDMIALHRQSKTHQ